MTKSEIMKISVARELLPVASPGVTWLASGLAMTVGLADGDDISAGASKLKE